jgi:hypothetical protein
MTGQTASTGFTSGGYNASDKQSSTGTDANSGGWNYGSTDKYLAGLSVDSDDFTPSHASLFDFDASSISGFPAVYFDGTSRGASSAPGAVPAQ